MGTSTSTSREAALSFAGDNGMLLQLDYSYGFWNSYFVRSFDCAGISNFVDESECLFMGGSHTIRIVNIQHIHDGASFEDFLEPLFYLDSIVNGQLLDYDSMIDHKKTRKHKKLLKQLISYKAIGKKYSVEYINDTFECMTNHKTEIIINLEALNVKIDDYEVKQLSAYRSLLVTDQNVIKPVIFDLFPNCKHVLIYATDTYGEPYKFDLVALKAMLDSKADHIKSNNVKITIIGKWNYYKRNVRSWIYDTFASHKQMLNSNGYHATIQKKQTFRSHVPDRWEDQLVITMDHKF